MAAGLPRSRSRVRCPLSLLARLRRRHERSRADTAGRAHDLLTRAFCRDLAAKGGRRTFGIALEGPLKAVQSDHLDPCKYRNGKHPDSRARTGENRRISSDHDIQQARCVRQMGRY